MAVSVYLDNVNITDSLNEQYPLPESLSPGVFPDNTHNHWWDLWVCIQKDETLRNNYQKYAVHTLQIQDSVGGTYNAKLILRTKYTARNR